MKERKFICSAAGWPEVSVFGEDVLAPHLLVGAQLAPAFERPPASRVLTAQCRLFEQGVLLQPLVVEQGTRRTGVFIYRDVSEATASHFAGAQYILGTVDDAAVYYAPSPLPGAPALNPLRQLDTSMFRRAGRIPPGDYAVWWSTPNEPHLAGSKVCSYIDRAYAALDGLHSPVFAAFLQDLGMLGDDRPKRVALPDEHLSVPMIGPEECPMFLCASAEKGIAFALPVNASVTYRDTLWKLFAELVEAFRKEALQAGDGWLRAEEEGAALAWWQMTADVAAELEGKGRTMVGLVPNR